MAAMSEPQPLQILAADLGTPRVRLFVGRCQKRHVQGVIDAIEEHGARHGAEWAAVWVSRREFLVFSTFNWCQQCADRTCATDHHSQAILALARVAEQLRWGSVEPMNIACSPGWAAATDVTFPPAPTPPDYTTPDGDGAEQNQLPRNAEEGNDPERTT